MNEKLKFVQDKLIDNLDRLDKENTDLKKEIARSNAISQLANTYLKTCNLIIRVDNSKNDIKNKIDEVSNAKK